MAGCGGDSPEPTPRPVEMADEPANVLRGWTREVNRRAGFEIGVPAGWTARMRGTVTVLRSPDELAVISVSADRTTDALEAPLDEFAAAAARSLPGFEKLVFEEARPYRARYEAFAVRGTGRSVETGVPQDLLVVAMRREGLATYTAFAARNARRDSFVRAADLARIIRSLRGRPVEAPASQ